jgi:transposase
VHLYYNAQARAVAVDRFNAKLISFKEELESNNPIKDHKEAYSEFFIVKDTPKRGRKITYNNQAVSKYINRYAGFQALFTNAIKDPIETLLVYRNKDVVEKSFDDLKNQLDMNRLRMHSAESVNGRLFIQFIALIYICALRKEMRKSDLIRKYTVRELLQEMETYTKIKYTGKYGQIFTELTKSQREILDRLNIMLPQKT